MSRKIRAFSESDYDAIVEIHNRTYPADLTTTAIWRREDENLDPRVRRARWVYEEDGRVLGLAGYRQAGNSPDEEKYRLYLLVHPDAWGRGIGGRLYDWLEEALGLYNPAWFSAEVHERIAEGREFLTERGYREGERSDESDWIDFEKLPAKARSAARRR